jgi:DNA repair ATPase RecN
MEDPSKFFNVIIDRTNQKLNSFQAQIIVLESQLQMANDERDMYKKYVDELPALNLNIEEHNNLKNDYILLERRYHEALRENAEYIEKIKIIQSDQVNSTQFIRDQNETLLQEIRRLKAEIAEMSTGK